MMSKPESVSNFNPEYENSDGTINIEKLQRYMMDMMESPEIQNMIKIFADVFQYPAFNPNAMLEKMKDLAQKSGRNFLVDLRTLTKMFLVHGANLANVEKRLSGNPTLKNELRILKTVYDLQPNARGATCLTLSRIAKASPLLTFALAHELEDKLNHVVVIDSELGVAIPFDLKMCYFPALFCADTVSKKALCGVLLYCICEAILMYRTTGRRANMDMRACFLKACEYAHISMTKSTVRAESRTVFTNQYLKRFHVNADLMHRIWSKTAATYDLTCPVPDAPVPFIDAVVKANPRSVKAWETLLMGIEEETSTATVADVIGTIDKPEALEKCHGTDGEHSAEQ